MVDEKDVVIVELKTKTVKLIIRDFNYGEQALDIEELLQVQYHNIVGDIITFPVIFNRINLIRAEILDLVRDLELDFDIFVAQTKEEVSKKLIRTETNSRTTKTIYPTDTEKKDEIKKSREYKIKHSEINKVKKQADIIEGIYWSAKAKIKMLETISAKIKPEEYESELIEGVINGVMIKTFENQFK